jgi:hypothetical protein
MKDDFYVLTVVTSWLDGYDTAKQKVYVFRHLDNAMAEIRLEYYKQLDPIEGNDIQKSTFAAHSDYLPILAGARIEREHSVTTLDLRLANFEEDRE